jgi:hypothetical protein
MTILFISGTYSKAVSSFISIRSYNSRVCSQFKTFIKEQFKGENHYLTIGANVTEENGTLFDPYCFVAFEMDRSQSEYFLIFLNSF